MIIYIVAIPFLLLTILFNWNWAALVVMVVVGLLHLAVTAEKFFMVRTDAANPANLISILSASIFSRIPILSRILVFLEYLLGTITLWPFTIVAVLIRQAIFKVNVSFVMVGGRSVATSIFFSNGFFIAVLFTYFYITLTVGHEMSLPGVVFITLLCSLTAAICLLFSSMVKIQDFARKSFGSPRINVLLYFSVVAFICTMSALFLNRVYLGIEDQTIWGVFKDMLYAQTALDFIGAIRESQGNLQSFILRSKDEFQEQPFSILYGLLFYFSAFGLVWSTLLSPKKMVRNADDISTLAFHRISQNKLANAQKLIDDYKTAGGEPTISLKAIEAHLMMCRAEFGKACELMASLSTKFGKTPNREAGAVRLISSLVTMPTTERTTERLFRQFASYLVEEKFPAVLRMMLVDTAAIKSMSLVADILPYITSKDMPDPLNLLIKIIDISDPKTESTPIVEELLLFEPADPLEGLMLSTVAFALTPQTLSYDADTAIAERIISILQRDKDAIITSKVPWKVFVAFTISLRMKFNIEHAFIYSDDVPPDTKTQYVILADIMKEISAETRKYVAFDSEFKDQADMLSAMLIHR